MFKHVLALLSAVLALGVRSTPSQQPGPGYADHAEIDAQGNIYVSSGGGGLIKMADSDHCLMAESAGDGQTVGCSVRANSSLESSRLDILLRGGVRTTIDFDAPIVEWHFWNNGRQVAVRYGARIGAKTYALCDTASGNVVEKIAEPAEEQFLPQWAKSAAQIQDESVPESVALNEGRSQWIAKVMRRIAKVQPGMTRSEILKYFTIEGGISNRAQRSYVYIDCPYIKVNVRFKPVGDAVDAFGESPDDIIETISQPYLNWSIAD
jgi:hypothetical protein